MRHRLEYVAVRAAGALFAILPAPLCRRLLRGAGILYYRLASRHRRVALENLLLLYPDRDEESRRRRVARAAFAHLGHLLFDLLRMGRMRPAAIAAETQVDGWEHLEAAHRAGRGIIVFSAHLGNWERIALVQGIRGRRFHLVARPLDNPHLDAYLNRLRTRSGNRVIPKRGAIRRMIRALRAGDSVGLVIDQHARDWDAVRVDFFGRSAATTRSLARLALRYGFPVVPVFSHPLPGGRWQVVYEPPVPVPESGTAEERIREFTQRCTERIERAVRARPQLWFWMHRRWRDPAPVKPVPAATGEG